METQQPWSLVAHMAHLSFLFRLLAYLASPPTTHQTNQDNGQKIVDNAANGSHLASQLLRLRYGVFAELDSPNHVTGEHYTHCQGRTVSQVIHLNICRRIPFTKLIENIVQFGGLFHAPHFRSLFTVAYN